MLLCRYPPGAAFGRPSLLRPAFHRIPAPRAHLHGILDGPVADFTLSLAWTPAPVLQVQWNVGYEHRHAQSEHRRNLSRWLRVGTLLALPPGFTFGTSAQIRRTHDEESGQMHLTLDRSGRRARSFTVSVFSRASTLFRFSPQLALIHHVRMTNAQGQDYESGETHAGRTRVVFRHPPRGKRWHARCLEER